MGLMENIFGKSQQNAAPTNTTCVDNEALADLKGQLAAIGKSQAVIEFTLDGKIITANENFLSTVGYTLFEIQGQHHSMFVDPVYRASNEYRMFWERLGRGEYDAGQYKRIAKGGKEVWIQASYNPIFDAEGRPFKVVKYATNITEQKNRIADFEGQLDAIGKSQAVIQFSLDGKILTANENFLSTLGYTLAEVQGQHHSMFVEPAYRSSNEYRMFWEKLGRGEYDAGQYKRIGKGGREIWIQASYNPIYDANGKPYKVVKYASDITEQKNRVADFEGQLDAIGKSQAVIQFSLDGKILTANENFLNALGYTLAEVQGQHHGMFVEPAYRSSPEYRMFWEKLGRGEYDAGQYKRIGRGGKEIWIQASYNPIFDPNGKPYKVVKYATDITAQVKAKEEMNLAVEQTQVVVESAKAGDLTNRIALEGKQGDILSLCAGVNSILDVMTDMVSQVKEASAAINTASQEIAAGNADLSSRTEEQASSLEETASSMEELSATVKQNAENAREANELAQQSNQAVVRGGESVQRVVMTMADIQSSSKKIADIIGVIDSIAFQTNILALNAAVEAARAGEQGRGFAVVASEVRSLAQRSATAAKEIKELIAESVSKVDGGAKLVEEAGSTMREVVTSFGKVAALVTDITNASREQASGIAQVTQAVGQMDEVTQQNAALVEEAAAAAESLEEQARGLVQAVAMFKLDDSEQKIEQAPRQLTRVKGRTSAVTGRLGTNGSGAGHARSSGRAIPAPSAAASDDAWQEF